MAVEKFIKLMMKRHKPVSHKDNHNRVLKNKPLKEKLLFNLLDLKNFIHSFNNCNCSNKYLYAIFKNGCVRYARKNCRFRSKIEKQSSENSALKSEIKKNSSYERIYDKAKKQGMSLENDNVKVVRNNGEAKIKIKK